MQGKPIPEKNITWNDVSQHYAILYIRYLQVFRKLEDCYDQIVHPQKRRDLRVTLDATMARVAQLRQQLYTFGPGGRQSDFPNLDGYLLDMKLNAKDLEVPIPRYFRERRTDSEEEQQRRAVLVKCLEEQGMSGVGPTEDALPHLVATLRTMTHERAIAILQRNERGRQAIVRAKLLRELLINQKMHKELQQHGNVDQDPEKAAVTIQKVIRAYLSRQRTREETAEELVFIGMEKAPPRAVDAQTYDPVAKAAQVQRNRKARQAENELKFTEALVELEQQVTNTAGPEIKDSLWDDRYKWWQKEAQTTGKIPKNLDGYYKMLADREKGVDNSDAAAAAAAEEERLRLEEEEKKKKRGSTAGKGAGKDADEPRMLTLQPSSVLAPLIETVVRYKEVWAEADESQNPSQVHDDGLARATLLPEVRERIRTEVDAQLMAYLANLQAKEAAKAPAKKTGKKKKEGGGGGGGGKKKKNKEKARKWLEGEKLCANIPLSEMIATLVKYNIIQEPNRQHPLSDFIGDLNLLGSAYQDAGVRLDPSMAQLRQVIASSFILPLGSAYVKQHAPSLNALLLYGPIGTGKTMLSRTIAHEARAVWFDLSPAVLERKSLGNKAEIAKLGKHMTSNCVFYVYFLMFVFLPA